MNKYKIGDKVTIRSDLEPDKLYGRLLFLEEMVEYTGKTLEISNIVFRDVSIVSDRLVVYFELKGVNNSIMWTEEMFAPLTCEKTEDTVNEEFIVPKGCIRLDRVEAPYINVELKNREGSIIYGISTAPDISGYIYSNYGATVVVDSIGKHETDSNLDLFFTYNVQIPSEIPDGCIPFNWEKYQTDKYEVVCRDDRKIKSITLCEELHEGTYNRILINPEDEHVESWCTSIGGCWIGSSGSSTEDIFLKPKPDMSSEENTKEESKHETKLFAVGDKVRVRTDLEVGNVYGGFLLVEDMAAYKGTIVTIAEVLPGQVYVIIGDKLKYCWPVEMFEPINETEKEFIVPNGYIRYDWYDVDELFVKSEPVTRDGKRLDTINKYCDDKGVSYYAYELEGKNYTVDSMGVNALDSSKDIFVTLRVDTPEFVPEGYIVFNWDKYMSGEYDVFSRDGARVTNITATDDKENYRTFSKLLITTDDITNFWFTSVGGCWLSKEYIGKKDIFLKPKEIYSTPKEVYTIPKGYVRLDTVKKPYVNVEFITRNGIKPDEIKVIDAEGVTKYSYTHESETIEVSALGKHIEDSDKDLFLTYDIERPKDIPEGYSYFDWGMYCTGEYEVYNRAGIKVSRISIEKDDCYRTSCRLEVHTDLGDKHFWCTSIGGCWIGGNCADVEDIFLKPKEIAYDVPEGYHTLDSDFKTPETREYITRAGFQPSKVTETMTGFIYVSGDEYRCVDNTGKHATIRAYDLFYTDSAIPKNIPVGCISFDWEKYQTGKYDIYNRDGKVESAVLVTDPLIPSTKEICVQYHDCEKDVGMSYTVSSGGRYLDNGNQHPLDTFLKEKEVQETSEEVLEQLYPVGSKVKLRDDLIVGVKYEGVTFLEGMKPLINLTSTVQNTFKNMYTIKNDDFTFGVTQSMLRSADEKTNKPIKSLLYDEDIDEDNTNKFNLI